MNILIKSIKKQYQNEELLILNSNFDVKKEDDTIFKFNCIKLFELFTLKQNYKN